MDGSLSGAGRNVVSPPGSDGRDAPRAHVRALAAHADVSGRQRRPGGRVGTPPVSLNVPRCWSLLSTSHACAYRHIRDNRRGHRKYLRGPWSLGRAKVRSVRRPGPSILECYVYL